MRSRKTKKLLKKIQDIIILVSEEVSMPRQYIKSSTIKSLIQSGIKDKQIIYLYQISHLDPCGHCQSIPIGCLKEFALRFFGESFTDEDLDSGISQLRSIFVSGCKKNYCSKTLVQKANNIAKEHEISDLGELQDILVQCFFHDPKDQSLIDLGVVISDEEPHWIDDLLDTHPHRVATTRSLNPDWVCYPEDPDRALSL
jgi:hypothetical protein